MLDITNSPLVLDGEDSIAVYEFIRGKRISIVVTENSIDLTQDEEHNSQLPGGKYGEEELNQLWVALTRVHRVDEFKLRQTFMNAYTINMIAWDENITRDQPQKYPPRGFVVVEVLPHHGTALSSGAFEDWCSTMHLPHVPCIMAGPASRVVQNLQSMRVESNFSLNKVPSGLVIRPEPSRKEGGQLVRWFVAPDIGLTMDLDSEDPDEMVQELIRTTFANPPYIKELADRFNIDPATHKTKFRNVLFNTLRNEYGSDWELYYRRCAHNLNKVSDNAPIEFEKRVKKALLTFVKEFVLTMTEYAYRV